MTECQIIPFPTKPKPVMTTKAERELDIYKRIREMCDELKKPGHPYGRVPA